MDGESYRKREAEQTQKRKEDQNRSGDQARCSSTRSRITRFYMSPTFPSSLCSSVFFCGLVSVACVLLCFSVALGFCGCGFLWPVFIRGPSPQTRVESSGGLPHLRRQSA